MDCKEHSSLFLLREITLHMNRQHTAPLCLNRIFLKHKIKINFMIFCCCFSCIWLYFIFCRKNTACHIEVIRKNEGFFLIKIFWKGFILFLCNWKKEKGEKKRKFHGTSIYGFIHFKMLKKREIFCCCWQIEKVNDLILSGHKKWK